MNIDNKEGAVGIIPTLLPTFLHPIAIIRFDLVENQPIRDPSTGLCIRCKYGESDYIISIIIINLIIFIIKLFFCFKHIPKLYFTELAKNVSLLFFPPPHNKSDGTSNIVHFNIT